MNGRERTRTPGNLEEESPDIMAYNLPRKVRRPARKSMGPARTGIVQKDGFFLFMDGVKSVDTRTPPQGASLDLLVRVSFQDEQETEDLDRGFPEIP